MELTFVVEVNEGNSIE